MFFSFRQANALAPGASALAVRLRSGYGRANQASEVSSQILD
jgi:hypothetical protein